jgi:exonuclease VII small subunit
VAKINKKIANELLRQINNMKELKKQIADKRTELRAQLIDFESILESLDSGLVDMEDGVESFNRAVDTISQYL